MEENIIKFKHQLYVYYFLLKAIILLQIIKVSKLSCDENSPFLKEKECVDTCTSEEIKNNLCQISNEKVKTQWINNIIYFLDSGKYWGYINGMTTQNNDLIILLSCAPASNNRLLYGITKDGRGYFNESKFHMMEINDPNVIGRFESEAFMIKLKDSCNDKEYILSFGKATQFLEIYDIESNKIYFKPIMTAFEPLLDVHQISGAYVKIASSSSHSYLIGLLAKDFSTLTPTSFLILLTFQITSLSDENINLEYTPQYQSTYNSKMVSCYETNDGSIVCFYKYFDTDKKHYYYGFYAYNTIQSASKINNIYRIEDENIDEDRFFKCVHYSLEIGAFIYYNDDSIRKAIIEFYEYKPRTGCTPKENKIEFKSYEFNYNNLLNDIVKLSEGKIFFAAVSKDKKSLYIVSIFKFGDINKDYFVERIYHINSFEFNDYSFNDTIRLAIFNTYLAFCSNGLTNAKVSFSSLIIFSYPNSTDLSIDITHLLLNDNEKKINNITIELEKLCSIENNIFGHNLTGIQIIEVYKNSNDVYLLNLTDNSIISKDQNLPLMGSLKLNIQKNGNVYNKFTYGIKYSCLAIDSIFEDYNSYAIDIDYKGFKSIAKNEFSQEVYSGRYTYYNFSLNSQLTEEGCKEGCELCYYLDKNKCITCELGIEFEILNNSKVCLLEQSSTQLITKINISDTIQKEEATTTEIINDIKTSYTDSKTSPNEFDISTTEKIIEEVITNQIVDTSKTELITNEIVDTYKTQVITNEIIDTSKTEVNANEIIDTHKIEESTNEIKNTHKIEESTNEIIDTHKIEESTNEIIDTHKIEESTNDIVDTAKSLDTSSEFIPQIYSDEKQCNVIDIIQGKCKGILTDEMAEEIYYYIKNNLINSNFTDDYLLIKTPSYKFQLSTQEFIKNFAFINTSKIDLGECENKLKKKYNISDEYSLIIFKIDIENTDKSYTFVQYEVFNPETYRQLNLDICDNILINITIPAKIDNETLFLYEKLKGYGYNLFDLDDKFYNDICTKYTTESKTDMLLSDRKNDIFSKYGNKSICQDGCYLGSYNNNLEEATCQCKAQTTNTDLNLNIEIKYNIKGLNQVFFKTLNNSNFRVLKCYEVAIDLNTVKENKGRLLMTVLLIIFIILFIIFIIKGNKQLTINLQKVLDFIVSPLNKNSKKVKKKLKTEIKKVDKTLKNKKNEKNKTIYTTDKGKKININTKNKNKGKKKAKQKSNPLKKSKTKITNKKKNDDFKLTKASTKEYKKSKKDTCLSPSSSYRSKLIKDKPLISQSNSSNLLIKSKFTKSIKFNLDNLTKTKLNKNNKIIKNEKIFSMNDQELNSLEYKKALIYDKRTYFQYYLSLLKKKHIILFAFIPANDYNLQCLKISLLILSFSLALNINGFFFSDKTMHKIYEDEGVVNYLYQIAEILYSTIISSVITLILRKLSLIEDNILKIKKQKNSQKAMEMIKKAHKCIKIQFIIFFFISFLLLFFFWYFVACFCGVYVNTQIILLNDTLISFALSMIYPFGLNLLPGIFRIPALRDKKKSKECMYTISRYVSLI